MRKAFLIFILILSLALTGCQLAKPEAEAQNGQDMLVSVFITEKYLDLFDLDAYFQDHANDLLNSSDITIENPEQYRNRIYAELTKDENGRPYYAFPDLEGSLLASFRMTPDENPENAYWSSIAGDWLCDVHSGHHASDTGSGLELTGTVYFSSTHPQPGLYFNPVYQTPEGDVYLLSGQGTFMGGAFGGSATHSMKEESSRTEDGQESTHYAEITVTMDGVYPAHKVIILQMDAENQILSRLELEPQANTQELKPDENCAYILVEEHTSEGIRRNLYEKDRTNLTFFRELENRMCEKATIALIWTE